MMQKLKWIVPGAIVGVGLVVWGILQFLGGNAEAHLRDALTRYDLQQHVHWQDVSTSFGSVTLNRVRIDLDGGWQAERVTVSDITDTNNRQRITLHIEGLTELDAQDTTSIMDEFLGLPSGKANLPPLDARVKLDVRYDKDTAALSVTLNQQDALDVDVHIQLTQILVLRALTRAALVAETPSHTAPRRGSARGRAQEMVDWTNIHLQALDVALQDRGMIKRGVALYKRHNISLDVDGGSIALQLNQGFAQIIQQFETDCRTNRMALSTQDAEQTCRALAHFLANDKDTLRLSIAANPPVPIKALADHIPMSAFFSDGPPSSTQVLHIEVKS